MNTSNMTMGSAAFRGSVPILVILELNLDE